MFFRDQVFTLAVLLVGSPLLWGYVRSGQVSDASLPALSVCEALTHASQYDGKLVRIHGKVVATGESAGFAGEECPNVLVTGGKVWPSGITWTMPSNRMFILHPVNFDFDGDSSKRLERKVQQLRKRVPYECIELTYRGMFEIMPAAKAKKVDPKGTPYEFTGFGHLNGSGAQLVLKSADDATPIPNCGKKKGTGAKAHIFSTQDGTTKVVPRYEQVAQREFFR
jgi:hypothetical protein